MPQEGDFRINSQTGTKEFLNPEGKWVPVVSPENIIGGSEVPTSFEEETPAGTLTPTTTPTTSSLGNLRIALRAAAEEAGKERVASRLEQFQGAGLGRTPGTLGSIADIVRGSVKPRVEQTFSDIMTAFKEIEIKKQSTFNMINTMIDNGVFVDTPAAVLLAMEKEAGLSEGTTLAWQARLEIAQKQSDEIAALQIKDLKQRIADAGAPSQLSNFIDIMQQTIDAGGTPEQAAREAALVSEAQGISVDQKTLNSWTEQARKLTKTPSPPSPPPPPPKTAYERGQALGGALSYLPEAHWEIFIEKPIQAVRAVGSFFSGLFGL